MELFVKATSSLFVDWLRSFVTDLDMGTVRFGDIDYVVNYEYSPPAPDKDEIQDLDVVQPCLTFKGEYLPNENLEAGVDFILLGKIEVRALDGGRLQVVFDAWNPDIENRYTLIAKEIIRVWPVESGAGADISNELLEKIPVPGKEDLETLPEKPKKPEQPPEHSNLEGWYEYFRQCKKLGFKYTLLDLAKDSKYSYGYIRQQYQLYKIKYGLDIPNKRT